MSKRKFYRHYKSQDQQSISGCYEVLGEVEDHETGQSGTVYRPCYCMMELYSMGYFRPTAEFHEAIGESIGSGPRFAQVTDPDLIKRLIAATDLLYGK